MGAESIQHIARDFASPECGEMLSQPLRRKRKGCAASQAFKRRVVAALGARGVERFATAIACHVGRFDHSPRGVAIAIVELIQSVRRSQNQLPRRWRLRARDQILALQSDVALESLAPRFAAVLGEKYLPRLARALEVDERNLARTLHGKEYRGPRVLAELLAVLELLEVAGTDRPARWSDGSVNEGLTGRLAAVLGDDAIGIVAAALEYRPDYLKDILRRGADAPPRLVAVVELLELLSAQGIARRRWPARWRRQGATNA